MSDLDESLRSDDWDKRYFGLISKLIEKNESVYELRAHELLKCKKLNVMIRDIPVTFELTPVGCSYILGNGESGLLGKGWKRLGWRKTSKTRALPEYFAQAEALVLLDREI